MVSTKRKAGEGFHETFAEGEIPLPSPRSTGLVFAAVAVIVALLFRNTMTVVVIAGTVAAVLLATSLLIPRVLQPLNVAWFRFGLLLGRIVNPVVMFLMFVVAFLPMGLLMRLVYDPLRRKPKRDLTTYWVEPDPAEAKLKSMKNQF